MTDVDDSSQTPVTLAHYDYDSLSRRTGVTLGNSASAAYDYEDYQSDDNLGNRLEKLTNYINTPSTIIFDYSYDSVGNRETMIIDEHATDKYFYYYDDVYQLETVKFPDTSTTTDSFDYDLVGNRYTGYTVNSLNQYTVVDSNNYSYDDNDNLAYDEMYRYYYDIENRLTDVNDQNDDPIASYSYDYLGRRISRTVSGTTTKYCYDGAQVIAEYQYDDVNDVDIALWKFIYGPGIDEPICMIDVVDNDAVYYYHYDGLGSVVALSNNNGDLVERYKYDAFGNTTILSADEQTSYSVSQYGNPYMFTGRRYDDETSLYYYRVRVYSPAIGRFLQTDPIGYDDGMNLYAYVGNNPILFIDPFTVESGIFRNVRSHRFNGVVF